jgi:hypothetical protein
MNTHLAIHILTELATILARTVRGRQGLRDLLLVTTHPATRAIIVEALK